MTIRLHENRLQHTIPCARGSRDCQKESEGLSILPPSGIGLSCSDLTTPMRQL